MKRYACRVFAGVGLLALGATMTIPNDSAWAAAGSAPVVSRQGASLAGTQTAQGTAALPTALQPALYRALAQGAGPAYAIGREGCVQLPDSKLEGCFDRGGAHFGLSDERAGSGDRTLALRLIAFGRGDAISSVQGVQPRIDGNRVSYEHGSLNEWWQALPIGFEQGFTVAQRPQGQGAITLVLAANGGGSWSNLLHSAGKSGDANGNVAVWGDLHYGRLVVTDAGGNVIPATLQRIGDNVRITVNDEHAAYPLTVDPLVWLEQKVTASDGAAQDEFGWAVALDGDTALVGARTCGCQGENPGEGAVYVFTKANGVWTQSQKLTANDASAEARFGWSVALDGSTALIGAAGATVGSNEGQGAVYVFTESDGIWSQSQKLVADDGAANSLFGGSVALSGTTALIGSAFATVGENAYAGAAYVFSESNGSWSQVQKLTASDGAAYDEFGVAVALSNTTVLIGELGDNSAQGAAYAFSESGGNWTQSQKLTADDGAAGDQFGNAVAIDGDTALIAAYQATTQPPFTHQGAAYVFEESGGMWTQAQKLFVDVPPGGGGFGQAVALEGDMAVISADNAVLVGNTFEGAAYLFENSGGTWAQTQELVASDGTINDWFGWGLTSVAIANGTALVGAYNATIGPNAEQGAAYFYGAADLGLALSAPQSVGQGQSYVSQTIATNNASAASPAVSATMTVPAAASFISATASQGSCNQASGIVTCDFGAIDGNAGTATANVTLKTTGNAGETIENTASIAKATPPLTASAATTITEGGACPDGYSEYGGSLEPGEVARSPVYQAPGGEENAILTAPAGFELYAVYQSGRFGRHVYRVPGNEMHRWGPKGLYMWLVRARDGAGAYTLCLQHP